MTYFPKIPIPIHSHSSNQT